MRTNDPSIASFKLLLMKACCLYYLRQKQSSQNYKGIRGGLTQGQQSARIPHYPRWFSRSTTPLFFRILSIYQKALSPDIQTLKKPSVRLYSHHKEVGSGTHSCYHNCSATTGPQDPGCAAWIQLIVPLSGGDLKTTCTTHTPPLPVKPNN